MAAPADPGSLQNLHDIVLPQAVSWWPLAPGWYGVAAVLALSAAAWSWRAWRRYRANRYRREALLELSRWQSDSLPALSALPILLKRTALAAYPRQDIANLSGKSWQDFLNTSSDKPYFSGPVSATLNAVAYGNRTDDPPPQAEIDALCKAIESWLRHHRPPAH